MTPLVYLCVGQKITEHGISKLRVNEIKCVDKVVALDDYRFIGVKNNQTTLYKDPDCVEVFDGCAIYMDEDYARELNLTDKAPFDIFLGSMSLNERRKEVKRYYQRMCEAQEAYKEKAEKFKKYCERIGVEPVI